MQRVKALLNYGHNFEDMFINGASTVEWNGKSYDIDALNWAPPVKGTVYGTLFNFKGEMEKIDFNQPPYQKLPEHVALYMKPANTISQHRAAIPLPDDIDEVEVRAALGVVIGKTMTQVPEQDALDYVAGYTVVNDITVPHDSYFRPDIKNKVRDAFCPVGPWIMDHSEVKDPGNLKILVYVNGELMQANHTRNLVRAVPRLLADITEFMTLSAGDVILAGTPEDAPRIKADDHVMIEIPGVGKLTNTLVSRAVTEVGGGQR